MRTMQEVLDNPDSATPTERLLAVIEANLMVIRRAVGVEDYDAAHRAAQLLKRDATDLEWRLGP